jgi:hypothetical protein
MSIPRTATAVMVLLAAGIGVATSMHGTSAPANRAAPPSHQHAVRAQPTPTPAPTRGADTSRTQHGHHHASHAHRRHTGPVAAATVAGVPAKDVPIRSLTPGRAMTTSKRAVCTPGYSSRVRDVPDSEKEAVYSRYGVPHVPYAHEVDHLVSLEIGGSNAITNLWPEPYAGRWGARTKDVLENRLHELVCSGSLDLRAAQRQEARNWVAAYHRYVGGSPARPATSNQTSHQSSHQQATSSSTGSGCEPGYSPCLPKVSDLDCTDIPADKRPVHVTGSDPYRLDSDGDGWGCES